MSGIQIPIEEYKPCRVHEVYLDEDGVIEISGEFRLKGAGRTIWLMLNGKHDIRSIAECLCVEFFCQQESEVIKKELITFLSMLKKRNAIVANWDPIYKLHLCQELEPNE